MFELLITATVPLICRIDGMDLLCNSPRGYALYAVGASARLLEESDTPAAKRVEYVLRDGEHLLVVPR